MSKKTLRVVAIVACFSILALSVPNATAAEKKAHKFNIKHLLKKPAVVISYFLPFLNPMLDTGNNSTSTDTKAKDNSIVKIKITGTLSSGIPSDGD